MLTQSSWRTTNQEFGDGTSWTQSPYWADAEPCEKDNMLIIKSNMTYEETEGATKCDPTDEQLKDSGTWVWKDNESKVVIDGIEGTISKLHETTFQITSELIPGMSMRVTYSH